VVLRFGNYLNGGTRNGGAYGFKLNTLNKLKSCKSVDNETTLLHYLANFLSKTHPEVHDYVLKLKQELEPATRVESSFIQGEMEKVKSNVSRLQKLLSSFSELELDADDRFLPVMMAFYDDARDKTREVEGELQCIAEEYKEMISSFGETADMKWEDLFKLLCLFGGQYASIWKQIEETREKATTQARRDKAKAVEVAKRGQAKIKRTSKRGHPARLRGDSSVSDFFNKIKHATSRTGDGEKISLRKTATRTRKERKEKREIKKKDKKDKTDGKRESEKGETKKKKKLDKKEKKSKLDRMLAKARKKEAEKTTPFDG